MQFLKTFTVNFFSDYTYKLIYPVTDDKNLMGTPNWINRLYSKKMSLSVLPE